MNWDGGPVTIRSITALRKSKVVQALDVDSTDIFLRDIEFFERSRSFTQEFQLLNNDADKLRWIVGARSEEHTSELQSLMRISYAVFCLKKKKKKTTQKQ